MKVPNITPHALTRYMERVRPGLDRQSALYDLRRLIAQHGERRARQPEWMYDQLPDDADFWLVIGDAVGFPVRHGKIITCLIPSSFPPEVRKGKSQSRGYRQRRNRARKMQEKTRSAKRLANRVRRVVIDDEAA